MINERILSGSWQGFYPGDWVRPRNNPGTWIPLIDVSEIFPGNRTVSRDGTYELYDARVGVHLGIERDKKSPLEFQENAEWESSRVSAMSMWKEDGLYHMLYIAMGSETCYATSDDCYRWIRPDVGEVEYKGSLDNNILANGPQGHILRTSRRPQNNGSRL